MTDTIFLWKSDISPIYVMDNHLCAAWCWMQECHSKESYNFMHIDQHADLKGCGFLSNIEFLRNNPHIQFEEYKRISYTTDTEYQFFQWDNYIRACYYLFPGWFNSNLFYTDDDNECSANDWGYGELLTMSRDFSSLKQDVVKYIQNTVIDTSEDLVVRDMQYAKWIVNIDLDFCWNYDGYKIINNDFIKEFGEILNKSMRNIKVLTIALSPDCIGGDDMEEKWENVRCVLDVLKKEIIGLNEFQLG